MKLFGTICLIALLLYGLVPSDAQLTKWTTTGSADIATMLGYTPAAADNWVASGTTNSTLPGVARVNGLAVTNGITFAGNIIASTDNAYDIGANGSTRPRSVYAATSVKASGGQIDGSGFNANDSSFFYWSSRCGISSPADSIILIAKSGGGDFNRLDFGGTTASFPSLKRSTTGIIARLADDSADTFIQVSQIKFGTNILSFSGTDLTWNGVAITVP